MLEDHIWKKKQRTKKELRVTEKRQGRNSAGR